MNHPSKRKIRRNRHKAKAFWNAYLKSSKENPLPFPGWFNELNRAIDKERAILGYR